jgi:hypothetical protein
MATITYDLPADAFSALRLSPAAQAMLGFHQQQSVLRRRTERKR